MKLLFAHFAAVIMVGAVGCAPREPGADLFASGRDARVYNPQTGRFDWPDDERPHRENKAVAIGAALQPTPFAPPADGRAYDLEKGRYDAPGER